jgi:hypothetical protein
VKYTEAKSAFVERVTRLASPTAREG